MSADRRRGLPPRDDLPLWTTPRPRSPGARGQGGATPPGSGAQSWLGWLVMAAGLAVGLAAVYWALPRWLVTPESATPSPAAAPKPVTVVRRIPGTLFTVSEDGTALTAWTRDIPLGATPAEQARLAVEAELATAGATDGRVSPIPTGVTVRHVFLTPRGDAYVDLSREILSGHPGGSLNETLTVYAIVHALAANVRGISSVQLLVEGRQVDTLAGHIDLRQPLAADPRWVQKGP